MVISRSHQKSKIAKASLLLFLIWLMQFPPPWGLWKLCTTWVETRMYKHTTDAWTDDSRCGIAGLLVSFEFPAANPSLVLFHALSKLEGYNPIDLSNFSDRPKEIEGPDPFQEGAQTFHWPWCTGWINQITSLLVNSRSFSWWLLNIVCFCGVWNESHWFWEDFAFMAERLRLQSRAKRCRSTHLLNN